MGKGKSIGKGGLERVGLPRGQGNVTMSGKKRVLGWEGKSLADEEKNPLNGEYTTSRGLFDGMAIWCVSMHRLSN